MTDEGKIVDGFKFMPPSLHRWIRKSIPDKEYSGYIPWTPLPKPCRKLTFALVTTAGISMKTDRPFDMEREKRDPWWGDPSYRKIPKNANETDINVNHLHVNTYYIEKDINVILPIHRFAEFESEKIIGKLAHTHYSIYGYLMDPKTLIDETLPKMAHYMKAEDVNAVVLTPT